MHLSRTTWEAAATLAFVAASALMVLALFGERAPRALGGATESTAPSRAEPIQVDAAKAPEEPSGETLDGVYDQDSALPIRSRDAVRYTMEARLDVERHEVKARAKVRFLNDTRAPLRELYWHLYPNAFKSERTTFMSRRHSGVRGSGALRDSGFIEVEALSIRQHGDRNLWPTATASDGENPEDETDMRIPLPSPLEPGEALDIDVVWRTKLPSLVERSGYSGTFHMVSQWFPKLARVEPDGTWAHFPFHHLAEFYADFGAYDVTISVPKRFEVGATGSLMSNSTEGDHKVVRYEQRDVHDFAFAAFDGFEELQRDASGVRIRCLYPKGFEAVAKRGLEAATFGLGYYGNAYGRYPYATLTIVHPPPGAEEAGGMEYPTLITTGGKWSEPPWVGWARSVTLHELGHQVFYGLVGTNERRWPFLDEGLATFMEVDALDAGWGQASAFGWGTFGISATTALRTAGMDGGHDEVVAKPAPDFVSGRTYATLVYARTALILRTLDGVFGPGDIRRALGRYARRYRYDHPDPSHLLGAVRDTAGAQAARALQSGLFDRGWVDYAVTDLLCRPSGEPPPAAYRCDAIVTRRGSIELPVEIAFLTASGIDARKTWDGRGTQVAIEHIGPEPVVAVVVDPEHRVLLDEDLANNAIDRRGRKSATRVLERLTYAAGLTLGVVAP